MLKGGYAGKVLRVNLSKKTFTEEILSEQMAKDYIGGAGFGIAYLLNEVPADIDPLSEANKLIFSVGPLTGTPTPCASRMSVVAKSPLTGAVGMCSAGGYFPAEMKFLGYDSIIIEGKADELTYLFIKDGKVSFRSAERLRGTTTVDCQQIIKDDHKDQNIRITCIGPAGEKMSKMSNIINEKRAAGRKGLGAVMGSKNLKAIAIRGETEPKIHDQAAYEKARKRLLDGIKDSPVSYPLFSKHGTPLVFGNLWQLGMFPAKNFSATGEWSGIDKIGIEAMAKQRIGNYHCYYCPVGCSQMKIAKSGPYAGAMSEVEYESIYSFGGATGVDNLDAIIMSDKMCDDYGLDTISVGVTIGFAMELYEKGIITKEDTDGEELNFGNYKAMVDLIHKIAFREGFGEVLADGTDVAAKRIGKGAEKYAMTVKGLELPGYDPRGAKAHGFCYATSYTGADHNRGYAFQEIFGVPIPYEVDRFAIEGKGKLTKFNQDTRNVTCDSAPMCSFLSDQACAGFLVENTQDLVNAVCGFDFTTEEVLQVGERITNAAKVFNTLAGFKRTDDTYPSRIMEEAIKEGESKGQVVPQADLDQMLDEYYEDRGWGKDSVPTEEKLSELGMDFAIDMLKKAGKM